MNNIVFCSIGLTQVLIFHLPVTQKLTRIPLCSNGNLENVHTGGAPPWLLSSEENDVNLASKRCLLDNIGSSTAAQNGRSKKLNPKRVGAAWAEKRRLELELEKQGKITQKPHDANWLPNFGRVWQAGTRKESRKEFEKEKRELSEKDQQSDTSFIVQPYLSKRMVSQTNVSSVIEVLVLLLYQSFQQICMQVAFHCLILNIIVVITILFTIVTNTFCLFVCLQRTGSSNAGADADADAGAN